MVREDAAKRSATVADVTPRFGGGAGGPSATRPERAAATDRKPQSSRLWRTLRWLPVIGTVVLALLAVMQAFGRM